MQDVSNDMDDLFQQAGEHYPLRINGEDWDKVLLGLQTTNLPVPAVTTTRSRHWRKALWLLLLLPLLLLYITHRHNAVRRIQPTATTANTNSAAEANAHAGTDAPSLTNKKRGKQENMNPGSATTNRLSPGAASSAGAHTQSVSKPLTAATSAIGMKQGQTNTVPSTRNFGLKHKEKGKIRFANQPAPMADSNTTHYGMAMPAGSDAISRSGNEPAPPGRAALAENNGKYDVEKQPLSILPRIEKKPTITDTAVMEKQADSAFVKEDLMAGSDANTTKNEAVPVRRLYGGLMGSFDVSTVKLQRINKTGYGINLLAGYRFSKRLSVEAGMGFTSKKYYTTGQYFDKSRTGIPPESEILFTNGVCRMIEIPVAMKYNFALQRKSRFFATAGLSSYLMKKEQYAYYAERNGWYYDASKSYKNSGANWLSVAGASVGYEHDLNKKISLRIEPYIKMPLRGIGIAKLPIMSTGVSAGVTRSF